MKPKYTYLLLIVALILYILIINLISVFSLQLQSNNTNNQGYSVGTQVKLNMEDSIGISIVRNRWYGKIYEEGTSKTLYLLNKIRLPIEKDGRDYLPFHIIFLLLWLLVLIRTLTLEQENPENSVFEGQEAQIQESQDLNSLNY